MILPLVCLSLKASKDSLHGIWGHVSFFVKTCFYLCICDYICVCVCIIHMCDYICICMIICHVGAGTQGSLKTESDPQSWSCRLRTIRFEFWAPTVFWNISERSSTELSLQPQTVLSRGIHLYAISFSLILRPLLCCTIPYVLLVPFLMSRFMLL